MKNIGINTPCSENWNEMSANEKGAFCQKCASQVHDFTKKTNEEIKQTLRSLIGQKVCGRITPNQEETLNLEFEAWANNSKKHTFQNLLFFSILVVFGLALFSCEDEQDKQKIQKVQTAVMRVIEEEEEKLETAPITEVFEAVNPPDAVRKEAIIMGAMESVCITQSLEKTPDQAVIEELYYLGGMGFTRTYDNFLIETVQADETIELDANGEPIPKVFNALAFPNPAGEQTSLELAVPIKNTFEISMYDLSGKFIQNIYSGEIERGTFRQRIDLLDLKPGTYLFMINSANFKETVKVIKI